MEVEITYKLQFESALLIGSGVVAAGVDRATTQDERGRLIIPGTTLKGRLRDECQRIASALGRPEDYCQPPRTEDMCPHPFLAKPNSRVALASSAEFPICELCQIFGCTWQPSSLIFTTLIEEAPADLSRQLWEEMAKTQVRASVAISRLRRVAAEERLYTSATSAPGWQPLFRGRIFGSLPEAKAVRFVSLLQAGLLALHALGGSKSRGLGWLLPPAGHSIGLPFLEVKVGGKILTPEEFRQGLEGWRKL
ncbi:MAG TPA: hypothetical protein EYP85_09875 [Armatimonadetes bacterium]|nr:hypothetical protein [Armatimonadota bacterium]